MPDLTIDPGELNVRLTWARREPKPGRKPGDKDYLWTVVVGTYSAKVETLGGAERYAAAQLRASVDSKITMRAVGDIRTGDTLTTQGPRPVVYTVETPTRPGERPGWIVLTATAAVAP